ncbi:MAG: methyltransferase domain-containing protein [Candidatus Symbiothrix sp.]|jgi:SAM-dependent methyltransferase|nr:methyltransferase domain-containing protein [Candidatus Symbiothrix sp.]
MKTFLKLCYQKLIPERRRIRNRLMFNKLTSVLYRGKNLKCNCCGRSFRRFKAKGNGIVSRLNAECPYCGSLERTRVLLFYLQNKTPLLTKPVSLLHFAPEWSLAAIFKKLPLLQYVSADINPNLARYQMDIMDIPMRPNTVDYIICSHVLGHIPDERKAISEMHRVLKPKGIALIMTIIDPNNPKTFETADADTPQKRLQYYSEPDLLRLHGGDVQERLIAGGFEKVEIIDYRQTLGDEICRKYALGDGSRELIFRCEKI